MKKRMTACLLLMAALLMLFSGCGENGSSRNGTERVEAEAGTISVTDALGRTVETVPGSYKRIVCIGAGALRLYSYVGDVSLLAGVEDIDNLSLENRPSMFDGVARPYVLANRDAFEKLPSCGTGGPNAQTPETEKILSLSPDLVISAYEDLNLAEAIGKQLGVPVVTVRTGQDGIFGEEFKESIRILGTVLSEEERAEELLSYVEAEIREIRERTGSVPETEQNTAYIAGLGSWGTTNHLYTSPEYKLFDAANIKNALAGKLSGGVQKIEEEFFVSVGSDIEYLFLDQAGVKNIKPLFEEDPALFSSVKAWKTGNVYLLPAYNAYYTNLETTLANAWFAAKTVYPELFSDIDIREKYDEITEAFLGTGLSEEVFRYGGYVRIDTETFFSN